MRLPPTKRKVESTSEYDSEEESVKPLKKPIDPSSHDSQNSFSQYRANNPSRENNKDPTTQFLQLAGKLQSVYEKLMEKDAQIE